MVFVGRYKPYAEVPETDIMIYSIDFVNHYHKNLTRNAADDFGPAVSPDGAKIALYSGNNVRTMGAEGEGLLFRGKASSDGAYSRGRLPTMSADGSGQAPRPAAGKGLGPPPSPTGEKAIFTRSVIRDTEFCAYHTGRYYEMHTAPLAGSSR